MNCPRCLEYLDTEEKLRKHLLCFPCRETMMQTRWFEQNGYLIMTKFAGLWKTLVTIFENTRMQKLQKEIEENYRVFVKEGQVKDGHLNEILHKMFKWIKAGVVQLRVKEAKAEN